MPRIKGQFGETSKNLSNSYPQTTGSKNPNKAKMLIVNSLTEYSPEKATGSPEYSSDMNKAKILIDELTVCSVL
ncbi:hypothetical protein CTI12_AA328280 [Artemisia annua]|uniref:Uncharacterized protein n=1 Tax=Artemisia annua TaxID=35608 RepID=A0A2U1MYG1_ARTAN|nr:hypothetical protein CTI12_AA328280 [Artemisia annua]